MAYPKIDVLSNNAGIFAESMKVNLSGQLLVGNYNLQDHSYCSRSLQTLDILEIQEQNKNHFSVTLAPQVAAFFCYMIKKA